MIKLHINKEKFKKEWLGTIIWGSILGVTIFLFIIFGVRYTGYIPKEVATSLVTDLETEYLYQDVFKTVEYQELKKNLLKQKITSKKDFLIFLEGTKGLTKDQYSYFLYDDIFSNTSNFKMITTKEDELISEVKNNNIGYISFKTFTDGTGTRVVNALKKFHHDNIDYLVIDLRDNSGGLTNEALEIADTLLPKVQIERSRFLKQEIIKYSDQEHLDFKKIFVLLNKHSASCSEILPLTLKENLGDKVILIGNGTCGKLVGQHVYTNSRLRYRYYIVSYKWFVYDKSTDDLNDYLKIYKDKELKSDSDYFAEVYKYINQS